MFLIVTVRCCLSHPISEADIKTRATELKLPIGELPIVTVGNTYHTMESQQQAKVWQLPNSVIKTV